MAKAFDHNGTSYVPFKALVEENGGSVDWNNQTKTAAATLRGHKVEVQMANEVVLVDGGRLELAAAPFVRDDTLYVPASLASRLGL